MTESWRVVIKVLFSAATVTHAGQVDCAVYHEVILFFIFVDSRMQYEHYDVSRATGATMVAFKFIFTRAVRCCQAFHIRAERLSQSSLSLAHLFVC